MTIKECIDLVDNLKPNQYSIEDKVEWLTFLDHKVINDVLKTHEGYDGRYDLFDGYSPEKLGVGLIVPAPYDRVYTAYLNMKIDEANGETARYNNSAALYNAYWLEYKKWWNKTHMPISVTDSRYNRCPSGSKYDITDAMYEKLKRDLYFQLSDLFSKELGEDKIYNVIMNHVYNHVGEYTGKDGVDGKDGVGIVDFELAQSNGLEDTYAFKLSDGSTKAFVVKNGANGTSPNMDNYYTKQQINDMFGAYVNDIASLIGGNA